MKSSIAVCCLALVPFAASAQIMYKCVEGGVTTYAERPCGKSAVAIGKPEPAGSANGDAEKRWVYDPEKMVIDRVAIDAIHRLEIVARNGGRAMDMCVQAGAVTAALLYAKEEIQYRKWKEVERKACEAAGLRR